MNNHENKYERGSLKDRIKELSSLGFLTVIVAAVSVFLMNLVVFPLSYFAVNNVNSFNIILKNIFYLFIITFILFIFFNKIKYLKRTGMRLSSILLYFIKRPFHYLSLVLFFILLSSILVITIYYLFSTNYYFIFKLGGGVQ
jgi:hypothetical protein